MQLSPSLLLLFSPTPYRIIFEEQVAPLIFNIDKQGEHQHDVDHSDEAHDDQAAVHHCNHQQAPSTDNNLSGIMFDSIWHDNSVI